MPLHHSSALSRRGFLGLGAGVGAAVLLGGCGPDGATDTGARSGASAVAAPVTVRTCVYAKNHASSALYWQKFAPAGYTIEVSPVTSATQIQQALEQGDLDFGLLAPYTPVIALAEDPKLITSRIVGMISRGGIGLVGRKGVVEKIADLRGKRLAVPPPTLQVLVLTEALKQAGLVLGKDVTAVPLGFADHVAALERGDVDAFMGSEPPATLSVVSGFGVRIPEVEQTRVGDFNTANWASAKILRERPDVVRAVCKMQKDAAEFLSPGRENDKANWRELLVTQFGFDEKVYEAVLPRIGARWEFDEERVAQTEGAVAMLKEQGGITSEPDVEQLFAREYWAV